MPDALPASARDFDEVLTRARQSDDAVAAVRQGAAYAGAEDPYKPAREDTEAAGESAAESGERQ